MKKTLITLFIILILSGIAVGGQLRSYPFPFIGKWQPAVDPLLIDELGFQDIQNVRKHGKGYRGVSGHTQVNTSEWNATYSYPRNGFHFRKSQPAESHLIVTAVDSSEAAPRLYENTTAIPSQGNFTATAIYTEDTSADLGRFSTAPQGNMVYCNGEESLIWGGNEVGITGFEVYDPAGAFNYDYYDKVSNTLDDSGNVAVITPTAAAIDAYTKLLLHFDGADAGTVFTDSGATTHAATIAGNVQTDTAYKKFGTASGLFDGTGDFITYPDHADWTLGTAEFAMDSWVKIDTLTSERAIASQVTDDGNYWEFLVNADGKAGFVYMAGTSSENTIEILTAAGKITTGTEYHVAVERDSDSNFYVYVNGELEASGNDTDSIANLTGTLHVGILNKAAPEDAFDGWQDELRITKGAQRYNGANFEPPIAAYSGTGISYMHIGSVRPLKGFKTYVKTANTAASTMTVYYWDGADWAAVSSLVDNTDTGASLAVTGTVTFTSTVASAQKSVIGLLQLYWYKVAISACDSTTTLSYITLDAPMQDMTNIWDTTTTPVAKCFSKTTEYEDFTDEVMDETPDYYAELDSLLAAEYVLLGFAEPQQGFDISMVSAQVNINNAVLTVSYWSGSAWVAVSSMADGTSSNGKSLNKSGTITFSAVSSSAEFPREIEQEIPLYWYKLSWSTFLDATVQVYHIEGIPVPEPIKGFKFPSIYQNRTWLFCEKSHHKSKAIYSAYNAPYIFNGSDSGVVYFGDDEELVAAQVIYNLYRTSGVEQLVVCKKNQTFRLFGSGPEDFEVQQLSGTIGCIAPLSMAVCPLSNLTEQETNRQVVIFQSSSGVIMCDGASMVDISMDIANYWDKNSSDFIPTSRQDDSVGWFDPDLKSYKLLISSGSGQATHNVELEYSLDWGEWTKIYREDGSGADPLQIGFLTRDTTGNSYSYGANNSGQIWRLENGNNWNGTAIAQYLWTKDFLIDKEAPFFKHTVIDYLRMLYKTKTGTGSVTIAHYCDGTLTVDGTDDQAVPDAIDITSDNMSTQDCSLGPCLKHSLKLSTSTANIADGMEVLGMGLYYDSIDTIQE